MGLRTTETNVEKPKGPGDCAACAKVLRHAVRYADGTDCLIHPGIEAVIRNALIAEREACALLCEEAWEGPKVTRGTKMALAIVARHIRERGQASE